MCVAMSGVMTEGHTVYWSEHTDFHSEILEEYGLNDTNIRGEITVVPFEIVPPNYDYRLPVSKWVYKLDFAGVPREFPNWYDAKEAEAVARIALKEWYKSNVVKKNQTVAVGSGEYKAVVLGTVADNFGTVTHNVGAVTHNDGTVTHNDGTVTSNFGTVAANVGTVTRNFGTVADNVGTVTRNDGTVTVHNKEYIAAVTNTYKGVLIDRSDDVPVVTVGVVSEALA